jgi:hypothetical protein
MERLQAKNARAVDERHDGDGILVHSIDNPVVPHNEFPVRTAFIFRNLPESSGIFRNLPESSGTFRPDSGTRCNCSTRC